MNIADTIQEILGGLEHVGIQVPWRTAAPTYEGSERDSINNGDTGFDLAGIKEWEPGERLANRPTARTGWRQLFTLVFEQPRELTVFAITEDSTSVDYGMVGQTKKLLSAKLKASVLDNASCTSELGGYGIWSGKELKQFRKPTPAGRLVLPALYGFLDPEAEEDGNEPDTNSGLVQALGRLPMDRRCLVFIVSDCLNLTPADMEALESASHHDIILLVVGDPRERELPSVGRGFRDIEDVESGQTVGIYLSDATRKQWREDFDRHRTELREQLAGLGISMEEFWTDDSNDAINEKLIPIFAGYRP